MNIVWRTLESGSLELQPAPEDWGRAAAAPGAESWFDVDGAEPGKLSAFLERAGLHPVQVARAVDASSDPGVLTFGETSLMEYPTALDGASGEPGFLTIVIGASVLITVRHGAAAPLDDLIREISARPAVPLRHLPQIVYLILDRFADLNVEAQVGLRERILRLSQKLAADPGAVRAGDLSGLREQADRLVSLIENQLYCVTGLRASDSPALREPHRRAFVEDLVSEAEIAQRGAYRLEERLNNLYGEYQMAGNDRVEKRLRFLTIVSAITLPLGLIAGLLGMNVGGLPGTSFRYGFLAVVVLMAAVGAALYGYFKRHGWFD